MILYKVLDETGHAPYSCKLWHLPQDGKPGKWMPHLKGNLVVCEYGYHLCRREDLVEWLGEKIYAAQHRGGILESDDKVVVRQARLIKRLETWNRRSARLFACDCAERVLPIFENQYPKDDRPRKAIEVARRFAVDDATTDDLSAARDAAGASVGDAAGASAWAAARASAWDAARDAARAAAWAAARDAAGASARDAAEYAERRWQTERLFEYLDGKIGQEGP